jgi:hypothetical protein
MELKTVTYTSRGRIDLTEADLLNIEHQARQLNALDGITGLLVYDGIRFLQIIEGAEDAIDDLIERLRSDSRHSAFEIRDERLLDARSFPSWSMELVRVGSGYRTARSEIGTKLPGTVTPAVREVALRMTDELASTN